MAKNKKTNIVISISCIFFLALILFQGYRYMNNYIQHQHDVRWAAGVSNAILTNYNYSKGKRNLYVVSRIVKSPVDKNLRTAFYLSDGTWLRTLDGSGGPWGIGGNPLGGNPFEQPLPEVMHITYFDSYDNQFYQLIQSLPKEKLTTLFSKVYKGMADTENTPRIYNEIEIGFAPKGWVIVTAVGPGIRQEIGSWQAKKIEADYTQTVGLTQTGNLEWLKTHDVRKQDVASALKVFQTNYPEIYKRWIKGEWTISPEWYKRMQTRYPWNLQVTAENGEWSGEYYAEYANTERYEILEDQIEQDKTRLKAVPIKLVTWITYKPTGVRYWVEVHLFPIPKWSADQYIPYYNDPNLDYFFKRFEYLYPKRSLATNEQTVQPDDFSTIKMDFDDDFKLKDIYLQKGNEKLPIEGAYEYYLAPVDDDRGKYLPEMGHQYFLTEPKMKDLTDPLFADRE